MKNTESADVNKPTETSGLATPARGADGAPQTTNSMPQFPGPNPFFYPFASPFGSFPMFGMSPMHPAYHNQANPATFHGPTAMNIGSAAGSAQPLPYPPTIVGQPASAPPALRSPEVSPSIHRIIKYPSLEAYCTELGFDDITRKRMERLGYTPMVSPSKIEWAHWREEGFKIGEYVSIVELDKSWRERFCKAARTAARNIAREG